MIIFNSSFKNTTKWHQASTRRLNQADAEASSRNCFTLVI